MLKQAGMSDEDMLNPENSEYIGRIIHTDWMKRNDKNSNNSYLFVPYEQLGDWEKGQDLKVFNAVFQTAKIYGLEIEPVEDFELPTPEELIQKEIAVINQEEETV